MAYIYIRGEFHYGAMVLSKASRKPAKQASSARTSSAAASTSTSPSIAAPVPTSAARRRDSSNRSKGNRGQPRVKPPFPAVVGVFGGPTVVNNVETLACVPLIVKNGADWFKSFGQPKNTGPEAVLRLRAK